MTRLALALAAAGLLAGPALAEQQTMRSATEAASLHDGPLDMVAFYQTTPRGALEVTATFAPRSVTMLAAAPAPLVLPLEEGDDVAFTVPGYPEAVYRFTRTGAAVTASVRAVRPAATRAALNAAADAAAPLPGL
jgi:hypothetical protein